MPPDESQKQPPTPDLPTTNFGDDAPLVDGALSDADSLIHILAGVARGIPSPELTFDASGFPRIPGYEILGELGRGGMGVVYKARQPSLNRDVALKMILTAEAPSAGQIARFRDEAAAVASVRHPNVVQVFELCPPECARPYFTMEYIEGGSLAKLLQAKKKLAPAAAAELLADVADGLQAAHDKDIVHRDIKPANILLQSAKSQEQASGESQQPRDLKPATLTPKLSDFGLAKRLAFDLTRTQDLKGTPAYMSPEQAGAGGYVGPGTDVYALGAVLFECLTGRVPFVNADQFAVVQAVLSVPAPSPRALEPGVPRDIELICLKCLEKEPQDRYPTAAALAADLRNFAAGRPVSVRPIGTASRVARWARRHRAAALLIVLTAALVFGGPPTVLWGVGKIETSAANEKAAQSDAELAKLIQAQTEAERIAAQKARDDALRLAKKGELVALQNVLRARAANRPLSWARANRAELLRAVVLSGGEPQALGELRSTAAVALLAADLTPLAAVQKGFTAATCATDPRTGLVAIGEFLTRFPQATIVRLIDPHTGVTRRELKFSVSFVRDPASVFGRPDNISALAFSPDGSRLFVGTRSSLVVRFDLDRPENTEAKRWTAAKSGVERLVVSPNGEIVYGRCGTDKPVFAWAADSGKLLAKLEPSAEAPITDFTVLGTGELITCDAHQLRRWDTNYKPALTVPNDGVGRLAVTPCGTLLAGDRRNLDIYDPVELTQLDRVLTRELRRGVHEENVRAIAVHPFGAHMASASGDTDRTIRVWELASCRLMGTVTVKGSGPIALAWSGDGKTLLATGDKQIARWAFRAPTAQRFACPSAAVVGAATFGPDGRVAALSEPINGFRELRVGTVDPPAGSARFVSLGGNGRPGVAFAPSGWLAVTAQPPGIHRWEPGAPVPPPEFVNKITWCPRFAPAECERAAPLWAVVDSSNLYSFDAKKRVRTAWSNDFETAIYGLASLDALAVGRSVVAAGGRSGSVHLIDPETGKPVKTVANPGDAVLSLAITPDDALVVVGTQSGKVRLIRTADGAELPPLTAHPDGVTAVTVSHDGALLATGSRDCTVTLWKRAGERSEPLFTVSDLTGPVHELQFHPSENRLLVLVAQERAARVWDIDKLRTQLGRYRLAW